VATRSDKFAANYLAFLQLASGCGSQCCRSQRTVGRFPPESGSLVLSL